MLLTSGIPTAKPANHVDSICIMMPPLESAFAVLRVCRLTLIITSAIATTGYTLLIKVSVLSVTALIIGSLNLRPAFTAHHTSPTTKIKESVSALITCLSLMERIAPHALRTSLSGMVIPV